MSAATHPHDGATPLLEVQGLAKHFAARSGMFAARNAGTVRAVDDVSFTVHRGETLALVGESGSGKSTTARLALRLIEPTAGTIRFEGVDITRHTERQLRAARRRMQMVFQDPYASLNPRMTVRQILEEPMIVHGVGDAAQRRARVAELLGLVNLSEHHAGRYPHEFSGGQRQRIGIARALALEPDLVVCDEPVSALDVSVQAQVVNLLKDLQARLGLTYLFISHDLAVVKHMSDRIAVMYLGSIVETGPKAEIFDNPRHPYTRMLLNAIPRPDPRFHVERQSFDGELPSPTNPPSGCRFHTRCPYAIERCATEAPQSTDVAPGHVAACHRLHELPPMSHDAAPRPTRDKAALRLALYARRGGAAQAPATS